MDDEGKMTQNLKFNDKCMPYVIKDSSAKCVL